MKHSCDGVLFLLLAALREEKEEGAEKSNVILGGSPLWIFPCFARSYCGSVG